MEEDLFPSQMMINSRADLEEERRLFYVAITRAEKRLFLSYALSRYRFGRLKNSEPSRFLDDIDSSFIKVSSKFSSAIESTPPPSQYAKKLVAGIKKTVTSAPPVRPVTYKPPADFVPSDTAALQVGMRVEHPKFGFGTVLQMDTSGADRKAKIGFKDIGEKTLLLSFAKLRILEN
jgi:DNA helicase-2/ATP-dependent DNA helicase PcrA